MQAVEERPALQALTRDEKSSSRALTTLQDNLKQSEERKVDLDREANTLTERKAEVGSSTLYLIYAHKISIL